MYRLARYGKLDNRQHKPGHFAAASSRIEQGDQKGLLSYLLNCGYHPGS